MDPIMGNGSAASQWAREIFAITLFEEDLEAAKQFYRQVFRLAVVYEDPNSCVFKIGATLINLLRVTEAGGLLEPARVGGGDSGARLMFTIQVEDVDGLVADLGAAGVTLINGPLDRPWGVRTASFMDPGGHIWEIAQQLQAEGS